MRACPALRPAAASARLDRSMTCWKQVNVQTCWGVNLRPLQLAALLKKRMRCCALRGAPAQGQAAGSAAPALAARAVPRRGHRLPARQAEVLTLCVTPQGLLPLCSAHAVVGANAGVRAWVPAQPWERT